MVKSFLCSAESRTILSILASICFLLGSILFLPKFSAFAVVGVWCFIVGSALFLIMSSLDIVFVVES